MRMQPDKHAPIRIAVGALGVGFPTRDLLVSPQHRILLSSEIAERVFGTREVLVCAKKLLDLPGVDQLSGDMPVTYWHILFEEHQIVKANGAWAESLFPGPQALKALDPLAVQEIADIMPQVLNEANILECAIARPVASGHTFRQFMFRHKKNQKPVFSLANYAYPEMHAGFRTSDEGGPRCTRRDSK